MNRKKIGLALLTATCAGLWTAEAQVLESNTDSVSYALGRDVGASLTANGVSIDAEIFMQGVNDGVKGEGALLEEEEAVTVIQRAFAAAAEKKVKALKDEENAFFDSIKLKPGVRHFEDGLYYEVIQEGTGAKPSGEDEVTVHYKGSLANGKEFDNSYERGEPLDIELARVIKGWQMGIPMMASGAKYKLYIPSKFGYGERGAGGNIPPYSPLIFEIELIGIKSQESAM